MSTATLTIRDQGNNRKEITVDCEHGTTVGLGANTDRIGDAPFVAATVLKHYTEEGCRCTRKLRRKYPPSLLPEALWVRDSSL